MKTMIAHLDADCFYVSCERVRYPGLCGKPVGVLGNQGACVIAKSYEAKAQGVKTGDPIWEAVELCPALIVVKRDFRWYEVLSRRLLEMLRKYSDRVEYYSVDEMFFEVKNPSLEQLRNLQQSILEQLGIPVTIGCAPTRTLAKLVSDQAKPFGCKVFQCRSEIDEMLKGYRVEEITGIASRRASRLNGLGIYTCWDFTQASPKLIRRELTIVGEQLWTELNGISVFRIQEQRPLHKCLSRGGSIGKATADPDIIWAWVIRNVERLIEELDYYQLTTRRLIMQIEQTLEWGWSDQTSFPVETADFHDLKEACRQMCDRHVSSIPVSRMHLLADQLYRRELRQRSLFSDSNPQWTHLARVKQDINHRMGRFSVRSGETLYLPELYLDEAHSYDICDIHGKQCF